MKEGITDGLKGQIREEEEEGVIVAWAGIPEWIIYCGKSLENERPLF